MKYLIFIFILTISACHPDPVEQPMSERIQGVWKQTFSPHSVYSFSDGVCIERIIATGTEVWRNEYAYTCQGDTMTMIDFEQKTERRWIVEFPTDFTARIETGGFVLNLKRWP